MNSIFESDRLNDLQILYQLDIFYMLMTVFAFIKGIELRAKDKTHDLFYIS